jgi:hypothetical protein
MTGENGRPRSTSGRQKYPRSARITRMSWAIARMAPAPNAWPLTAATVTTGEISTRASRALTRST